MPTNFSVSSIWNIILDFKNPLKQSFDYEKNNEEKKYQ